MDKKKECFMEKSSKEEREILGFRLKIERAKLGLTQKQLGKRLGFTNSMVCAWEKGLREPKATTIEKMYDMGMEILRNAKLQNKCSL